MKKTFCLIILSMLSLAGYSQRTLTDSIRAIRDDKTLSVSPKVEKMVQVIGDGKSNPAEKLDIDRKIILPLIEKIKEPDDYNTQMAGIYRHMASLHYQLGDMQACGSALDSAVVFAGKTANDTLQADIYKRYAGWHAMAGSAETAHEYLYKALDIFDKLNDQNNVASVLLSIANTHSQFRDHDGLGSIVARMRELEKRYTSTNFLYNMYQIQGAYYHLMFEAFPDVTAYRDSTIMYMKKGIDIAETSRDQLSEKVEIAWIYYNIGVVYLNDFDPPLVDSAKYYLDKIEALDLSDEDENDLREIFISVNDTKAWLHYYRGEYTAAERKMLEVLDLLGQQLDPNMVIPEYSEAYSFMAMLCEETGRPAQALKYQKLLNENQSERFKEEKMHALKELNTKYEVDKKEAHIVELQKEKRYVHRIFVLTLVISGVLLVVILLLFVAFRLRRKGIEQKLYERALIAEQQLEALEYRHEGAGSRTGSQIVADKIRRTVESSALDAAGRQKYLDAIRQADIARLEQAFVLLADKLTPMDMKYIFCFYIGIEVADIATIFNVEPASIYAVRYRIKKKYGDSALLDAIM